MTGARDLPLSMVTLVFGVLSIPLAFAVQLVVPAAIMALLSILFHGWGRWKAKQATYSTHSLKRSRTGFHTACIGLACAIVMWVLWASNVLLER